MRILAFCDNVTQVPKFWRTFGGASGVGYDLFFLICNNSRRPAWLFLALQVAYAIRSCGIRGWLALAEILWTGRLRLSLAPLGSAPTLQFLEVLQPDLGLHAMGVIYRSDVINRCGMGILNAHIGRLPKFRGRSVMEWSMLCGEPTGTTVFFIDAGIDTGSRIVHWEAISVVDFSTVADAKRHLFSKDVELYLKAVDKIERGVAGEFNDLTQGLRFYEMSSLFAGVLQSRAGKRELSMRPPPRIT